MTYSIKQFVKEAIVLPAYAGARSLCAINAYGKEQLGFKQSSSSKLSSSMLGAMTGAMLSCGVTTIALNAYEDATTLHTTTQKPYLVVDSTTTHPVSLRSKQLGALHPMVGVTHHFLTREPVTHSEFSSDVFYNDLEELISSPHN